MFRCPSRVLESEAVEAAVEAVKALETVEAVALGLPDRHDD
jgi:hypothetical protein